MNCTIDCFRVHRKDSSSRYSIFIQFRLHKDFHEAQPQFIEHLERIYLITRTIVYMLKHSALIYTHIYMFKAYI